MSEMRLVVRDANREVYANRHGSFADRVIAALSADPETIEELEVALERFIAPDEWSYLRGFRQGADDQPYDAGIVIVDLAARLVACDSSYSSPERNGSVHWHDGREATDIEVSYHLADDWEIIHHVEGWRPIADRRRAERAANPRLDARVVLYGEPLMAFIARECLEVFRDRPLPSEDVRFDGEEYGLMRQIHVRWMMTPRDDLRGRTPREVMMERSRFVSRSLQDRAEQWSQTHRVGPVVHPDLIDRMSRDFGNLRDVAGAMDVAAADALLEPVIERFCESLDAVAVARSDLEAKYSDLQARLRRFREPVSADDTPDMFGDDGLPY